MCNSTCCRPFRSALSGDTTTGYHMCSTLLGDTTHDYPLYYACPYYNRLSALLCPVISYNRLSAVLYSVTSDKPADRPSDEPSDKLSTMNATALAQRPDSTDHYSYHSPYQLSSTRGGLHGGLPAPPHKRMKIGPGLTGFLGTFTCWDMMPAARLDVIPADTDVSDDGFGILLASLVLAVWARVVEPLPLLTIRLPLAVLPKLLLVLIMVVRYSGAATRQ
jgi:hypothetical protein